MTKKVFATIILGLNLFAFLRFYIYQDYPLLLLFLHLISIAILWVWVINPIKILNFIKRKPIDSIIILGLFFLALTVRLYKIEVITPGMWSDEIVVGKTAELLFDSPGYTPFISANYGHPTPLLYLTGFIIKTFGRSMTTVRLVSVLFGSLNIAAFFILLRFFFKRQTALIVSLLMLFSYSHLIISRFAYEMTAAIFFQILTVIFIYLAFKTRNIRYFVGLGLAIGAGLFTYLGFRTNALVLLLFGTFLFLRKVNLKKVYLKLALIVFAVLISTLPLISYGLKHQEEIWARAESVSVFHQKLPINEVLKELRGSSARTLGMFLFTGDPNPRQNPAGKTMFDYLSVGILIVGLIALWKKRKDLFLASIFLSIPSFVNDIFTIELFPEFHYYGTGHPNIFRISTLIPIVYFCIAWGFKIVREMPSGLKEQYSKWLCWSFAVAIVVINWTWYFKQPISRFNYEINGVRMLKVVQLINDSERKKVFVSPSFIKDERVEYFLGEGISLEAFVPGPGADLSTSIPSDKLIILDPRESSEFSQKLIREKESLYNMQVNALTNPWNEIDVIVVYRAI